jgi:hypothetical protein
MTPAILRFSPSSSGATGCYRTGMSVARVCGPLICALAIPLGCGERAGDPVVRLPTGPGDAGETSTGGAASAQPGSGGTPADGTGSSTGGPIGLCGDCTSSDECGDANDACLRYENQNFCGRDCDDQHGCPDGYACVELANSQLWQCVPQDGCPVPSGGLPELVDVRQYLLGRINAERGLRDEVPLLPSGCLDQLAQQSALAFARTDEPLGKYVKECDPVWPYCACGWSAEAELTIARYGLDWTTAIERAVDTTRGTANDRFTQAFLSLNVTDVGIGFWLSGDEAWIALSFR